MAKYDASILQTFADRLYNKAGFIAFQCFVVGALIGAALPVFQPPSFPISH
jgi:hypothetical protein